MQYNWKCRNCGFSENRSQDTELNFCPKCGVNTVSEDEETTNSEGFDRIRQKAQKTLCASFEFEKIEGFSIARFLHQIFKKHSWDEIEDYVSYGIPSKRPELSEINTAWPAPWLFFRIMLVTIAAVLFCYWKADFFGKGIVLPLMIFGVIGIPFATLILFWEINIPRNISILLLIKTMLLSGFISIAITLLMHKLVINPGDAIWAGPMEETAKGLTMLFILKNQRYCYKINGLLIGAAVGTGFAFIESGQYTLEYGATTMNLRAFMSPFAHIPWSAMVGFALWRTCRNKAINFSNLKDRKFIALFVSAVLMHMFWNSRLLSDELIIKTAIIAVIEYTIIIYMIQEGINEIRNLKNPPLPNS